MLCLQVSEELAQKLGREDADRLLKDRKLVLLVDLDQTLVHTTNDNVPPNLKVIFSLLLYKKQVEMLNIYIYSSEYNE